MQIRGVQAAADGARETVDRGRARQRFQCRIDAFLRQAQEPRLLGIASSELHASPSLVQELLPGLELVAIRAAHVIASKRIQIVPHEIDDALALQRLMRIRR